MNTVATTAIPRDSELQQNTQALATSESSRTLGEIQAMLTVASARPRDEIRSIQRIKNACERQRLAEQAEYSYSKGGQSIKGATIRLLEVIGQNWGNMTWGFRELSQVQGVESTVQAYAWDLENNVKITRDFVVPHAIKARGAIKVLTDPREIYELIANQAQRRVRTCLENCIPRDVVEDAVDACNKTVVAKCELTPERIQTMQKAFRENHGVRKSQLEGRIQRNLDAIEPAQFLSLMRIFNSIKNGMSEVGDWFEVIDAVSKPINNLDGLTDKISGKTDSSKSEETEKTGDTDAKPEPMTESEMRSKFGECKTMTAITKLADELHKAGGDPEMVDGLASEYVEAMSSE